MTHVIVQVHVSVQDKNDGGKVVIETFRSKQKQAEENAVSSLELIIVNNAVCFFNASWLKGQRHKEKKKRKKNKSTLETFCPRPKH